MLVLLPTVMAVVLPSLPSVRPLMPLLNVRLLHGQLNALLKLVPSGSMVKVPWPRTLLVPFVGSK